MSDSVSKKELTVVLVLFFILIRLFDAFFALGDKTMCEDASGFYRMGVCWSPDGRFLDPYGRVDIPASTPSGE